MFGEWLSREFGAILSWWMLVALAGVAVFPLLYRWMGRLPSRGYTHARAAGLMLVGFVYWFANTLGLMSNNTGSAVLAWLIVVGVGIYAYATLPAAVPLFSRKSAESGESAPVGLGAWLRDQRTLVIATEVLFVLMFLGWAVVRALYPDLIATEKPMEMAFLSSVRRSAVFPPADPWLSGYAISYYHFGYIIMGTLANLSGVSNGVAFNLGVSLLFGLVGIGVFGLVYDLVMLRRGERTQPDRPRRLNGIAAGLLGVFFLALMGNFGMIMVEMPLRGGIATDQYLSQIDLMHRPNVNQCPPTSMDVNSWCYWWWWAYSRVVYDRTLDGAGLEIITEFPQFSFILSDMHPHVLSLPFVMLVLGLGLNLVVRRHKPRFWEMLLYGILVGGMVFLNSWDAVFLVFFVGAEGLRRLMANGTGKLTGGDWRGLAGFTLQLFLLTGLLYLPFFLGFRTQAGGFIPNVIWMTRIQQLFVMFGPFLIIFGFYLYREARRAGTTFNGRLAIQALIIGATFALAAVVTLAVFAWINEDVRLTVYRILDQSGGIGQVLIDVLGRRIVGLPTVVVLGSILLVVIARLFAREPEVASDAPTDARQVITYSPSTGFTLLLIGAGAALALAPEFGYLRDGFGTRINTIFKLYYQSWLLWSAAAAYACWSLIAEQDLKPRPILRTGFSLVLAFLIFSGALYPVFAIYARAIKESGRADGYERPMTLDGAMALAVTPGDYETILCLANYARSEKDVVAEATKRGLAYNRDYGRVSALTGIPTLLGWDNHEGQWRGTTFTAANTTTYIENGVQQVETRYDAVANLYNTTDPNVAMAIVKRYGITYIYVGPTERREFSELGLAKFAKLNPVCAFGDAAVYSADSLGELLAPENQEPK